MTRSIPRPQRTTCAVLFAGLAGAAMSSLAAPETARAQESRSVQVLVAPVETADPVGSRFGVRVADEIRRLLSDFPGYNPIDRDEVRDRLRDLDMRQEDLGTIEWRQLGALMKAGLVMTGMAEVGASGISVDVAFVDPASQDELPIDPVMVGEERDWRDAASMVMAGFEEGVEYLRSIAFCADYLNSNQPNEAIRNCTAALEMNPAAVRPYYLRGRAHMLLEDWASARDDLLAFDEVEGADLQALQSLGYVFAQLADSEKSLEYSNRYLEFQPDAVDVRLRVAYELSSAGTHMAAMQIVQQGLERDPENIPLNEYLGSIALNAGRTGGVVTDPETIRIGIEALERVRAARGDEAPPQLLISITDGYYALGDQEAALDASGAALEMLESGNHGGQGGDNGEAGPSREVLLSQVHDFRARIYVDRNMFDLAVAEFEQAVTLNPDLTGGQSRLAAIRLRAGDVDGAVEGFGAAIAGGADGDIAAGELFGYAFQRHMEPQMQVEEPHNINVGALGRAASLFEAALEFAQSPQLTNQINFFLGYGRYLTGTQLDAANTDEACEPAQRALVAFQGVAGPLSRAGDFQASNQGQIRAAAEEQVFRQEQIMLSACER